MKFKNYIETESGIKDTSTSPGTAGQVLSSTVTGTSWIDQGEIVAAAATVVVIECKNTYTTALAKGTPVYQTGTVGATDVIEIAPGNALISSGAQPSIGLLQQDLDVNEFGFVIITGELLNITTDPIDGLTPVTGQKVFVKSGGGLTLTKPTTELNSIQNMGLIGKVSGGNAGSITVSSIMRTNDVPNLPTGRIWIGDGNTVVSDTVYVDEPNGRVGIGTTSPGQILEVNEDTAPKIRFGRVNSYYWDIGHTSSNFQFESATGGVIMHLSYLGNVGIGTTSPTTRLDLGTGNTIGTGLGFGSTSSELRRGNSGSNVQLSHWGNLSMIIDSDNNDTTRYFNIMHGANDSSAAIELFRVQENGNVGIGTTSPRTKLHVSGLTGDDDPALGSSTAPLFVSNTANSYGLNIGVNSTGASWLQAQSNTSAIAYDILLNPLGGDVGIGTTSPGNTLSIAGGNPSTTTLGTNFGQFGIFNNLAQYGIQQWVAGTGNGNIQVGRIDGTATAYNLILQGLGGNVGIGTTSPGTKLQVGDGTDNAAVRVFHSDNTYTEMRGYGIITNRTTNYYRPAADKTQVLAIGNDGNTWNYISHNANYHTFSTDLAERMRIDLGGNVGIGTTSPSAKLELSGASGQLLILDDSSATGNPYMSFYQAGVRRSYIQHVDSGDNLTFASEYGGMRFMTGTGGTEVEKMRITNGGNVGIGITSPTKTLEVAGTGIKLVNAANTHTHLLLDTATYDYKLGDISTAGGAYMQILSSTNQTFIYNSDVILSNNYQVKLTRDNVASTTADSCIYVDNAYTGFGNPYNIDSDLSSQFGSRHVGFRYNGTIVGYIGANGTTAVTYSTTSSDERLKKNIEDWQENILDKFEKIEPKKFNFISEEEGESKTRGFIAQKMAEDFPEAYPHDYSEDKYYSFNPSGMVVYLMKAVKDLVEQNKKLETRIQTLEQQK